MTKEAKAYIKNLPITPKKLRFLLPTVKKMTPKEALEKLPYINKKAARIFYKVIKSAVDNAKNLFGVKEDMLKFKLLTVEEGLKLRRWRAGSRGRAMPYRRRKSHIKVVLEVKEEGK